MRGLPARRWQRRWGWLPCLLLMLASPARADEEVVPQPAPKVVPTASESALLTLLRSQAGAFEHGDGVPQDGTRAAALYCEAARLGDVKSQFALGWMYANGRGVDRNDSLAAFFFTIAAEQGDAPAQRMLRSVGGPSREVPECMRDKAPAEVPVARATPPARAGGVPLTSPWELLNNPAPNAPKPIVDLVRQMAPQYQVRPDLVLAVMQVESNFNTVALSPANARGLMQLIPDTAARFGVRNAYDPEQNIRGGMAYLRWLLAYFEGDVRLVLAAYNAGEGAVERYRGVPPYLETRSYVYRILAMLDNWTHPFDAGVTPPSAELRRIQQAVRRTTR